MEHFYQNIQGWAQPHEQGELFNTIVDNPSGKLKTGSKLFNTKPNVLIYNK